MDDPRVAVQTARDRGAMIAANQARRQQEAIALKQVRKEAAQFLSTGMVVETERGRATIKNIDANGIVTVRVLRNRLELTYPADQITLPER